MTHPRVSAITVTYHTGPRLRDCLAGLASDPQLAEIMIIDNGNPAQDAAWLDGFVARVDKARLVRPKENLGFARAANLGAREAGGNLLVFINPDAVMKRGSVEQLVRAAAGRAVPCIVGGKVFGVDGHEQRGARRRTLNWATALGLRRWTLETTPPPDGPVEIEAVSGAFMMMAKQPFLMLDGGFDEAFFLHVEDIDLCRRAYAAGGSVIYQPAAGVMHEGASSATPAGTVARHKADSLRHYFRKHARTPLDKALNLVLLRPLAWWVRRRG